MGAIHVTVNLSWSQATSEYENLFRVDTENMNSMAPAKDLKSLGFKPAGKMDYELANGQKVTYEYCGAVLQFMGDKTFGRVIMGPDGIEPILGVTALESTGITIDPANKQLKRLPAIPLK